MKSRTTILQIWRTPALRVGMVYGISGLGFAGGNLLLARVLPVHNYGILSLAIALLSLSVMLAPAGADGVVNRRKIDSDPSLLWRTLLTSTAVAILLLVVASYVYRLPTTILLMLVVGVIAGGATMVAAAQFQSRQRFGISLALSQCSNFVLGFIAIAVVFFSTQRVELPFLIFVVGLVATAIYGWHKLFSERRENSASFEPFVWGEAFSYLSVTTTIAILIQLERLVIPKMLTLEELATFGVLAAIVGSPFRILQMSIGFTLLPRLRAAETIEARRILLWQEGTLVGSLIVLAGITVWFIAPLLVDWILLDKYYLPPTLVLAALVAGVVKALNGFAKATVNALCDTRQLAYFSVFGWISTFIAIIAAVLGSRWGLTGIIFGVSLGWLVRGLAAAIIIAPSLRQG